MLINVLDSQLRKVAMLSNDVPGLPNYYNDEFHDYLDQGATTHKFTVSKIVNNKLQDYVQFLNHQSYFSFSKNGQDYLMSPASSQAVHETSSEISFVCVSLDRELMNEMSNPLANTASHNIQWYFDTMGLISRTQITIGINEVASFTRTISYDGQETKLSRLISVINNFNAEFEFVTKLNNDGTLDSVTLNIYQENDGQNVQGVGTKRDDVRLSFGKNIEDMTVDVSDDGFFNSCYMTGADGYSWKDYDFSYKNADGVEEFYKRKGSEIAYAPLSAQMFPSQLKTDKGDIWTSIDETTEYNNANDMWDYIVSKFKQYAYHQITYTVTPSATLLGQLIGDGRPLQKGDTVIIQDNNYIDINGTVGLILSARVSEIIESESNPENNQIVFSNYKKLKSQASADIQSIVSQLVDEATPYRSLIETTNGTQFKNGTGSTVLTARIYKGSSDTETVADSYVWIRDGTTIATTQAITVNATDINDKSVYTFKATVGGKTVGTLSVTITNVNDGKGGTDGKTSYTHTAYAYSSDGTDRFTTVYPNLNLLKNTRNLLSTSTSSSWSTLFNSSQIYDSAIKTKTEVSAMSFSFNVYIPFNAVVGSVIPIQLKGQNPQATNVGSDEWNTIITNSDYIIKQSDLGKTIRSSLSIEKDARYQYFDTALADTASIIIRQSSDTSGFVYSNIKLEIGSTATPYMPSSSEATTTDYPSFIGQYTDFEQASSAIASSYTWSLFRGKDGTPGTPGTPGTNGTSVTITSEQILYQNSTSGTTAPTGTWSTTITDTPQGQFRWVRTIVNYSDGTSTQTDLVGYVGVDGKVGPQGNPTGITQQATEPSNKYAGMMWQYTGTDSITIDSTTIAPQVQYIYDGAQWRIYAINVANLNVQTLSALTANLGTVTAGMIKSYIDYTYYNNSATGIPAKAYLRIDANNVNQKIALQSPSGVDWGYIRQDLDGLTIFTDTQNAGSIGNASGRYVRAKYSGSGINFINSNNASVNANGDLDVATPYTGTGSLYFDGTNLISSAPIIALNTIIKSYSFSVGGLGVRLDRLMSQVMVTFSGQVTSAITGTPTFNNQLPTGFCPINPASVDYMVVGNINANGYIYFNPDGSIRFMANVPQGAYIRGTRSYITADAYPS